MAPSRWAPQMEPAKFELSESKTCSLKGVHLIARLNFAPHSHLTLLAWFYLKEDDQEDDYKAAAAAKTNSTPN